MGEGLVGALTVLVPVLLGAIAYLGTRGQTRVNRQAQLDEKADRIIDQLQEEVARLTALVDTLRANITRLESRLREVETP